MIRLVKKAAIVAMFVGLGVGNAMALDYEVTQDAPAGDVTLGGVANQSLYFGTQTSQGAGWDKKNIVISGATVPNVYLGTDHTGSGGYKGTLQVNNFSVGTNAAAGGFTIKQANNGASIGKGMTLQANAVNLTNNSSITLDAGVSDSDMNQLIANSLTVGTATVANNITIGTNALMDIAGATNFNNSTTNVTLNGGKAVFHGDVNLGKGTTFTLNANAVADFQKGLEINDPSNAIKVTSGTENVVAAGSKGVTAGALNAISLSGPSTLYVMAEGAAPAAGGQADGILKVTKAQAIELENGSVLETGNYIITSGVAGSSGGLVDLYSSITGGNAVNANTFTVEKGAHARGSNNVALTVKDDVSIAGHYSLANVGTTTYWHKGATVSGTLESTGISTIETGLNIDDTVNFNVDGGTIKTNLGGVLTLDAKNTSGKSNLNFYGAAGSTIDGNVDASKYDVSVKSDLTFKKNNDGLIGNTYTQSGSKVLMADGATGMASIQTLDENQVAKIMNNSVFGVNGNFAGDVNVTNASTLLGTGRNTIDSGKTGGGIMTIDGTSGIDLRKGGLDLTRFNEVNSDGYLYLGADTAANKLNTLDLGGATMRINHDKVQMNDDFVKTYYNRGSVTDGGTDAGKINHFVTNGTVNNGTEGWTVSNIFGDFTFKNGANGSWVETYNKTNLDDLYAVEHQLVKNWGSSVISSGMAGVTALAGKSLLGLDGLKVIGDSADGFANLKMLQSLATGNKSFDLGNGVTGTFDEGLMAGFNGQMASGPIYVAQDTFRDIATGLHSRLDAYRKVIECINTTNCATPTAYGSLGLANVDRYMNRLWVGGFGTWQKANARNGFAGYEYDGAGVSIGYDRSFGPMVVGASFTYVEGDYDDKTTVSNDSKIKQYVANAYATYNATSGFFATLMGGYNYGDNDMREVRGGLMTTRDYHTHNFYAGGRLGYDIEPCDNLSITPSVGVDFFWSKSSEHDVEFQGTGLKPWRYGEMKNHNIEIPVEVKVAYEIPMGDNKALTLMANGGYAYNLNDHGVWGSTYLNGNDAPGIRAVGRKLGHHSWKGGAGIKFRMNSWDIGVKYDYQGRSNYNAHRLMGQVGYSF